MPRPGGLHPRYELTAWVVPSNIIFDRGLEFAGDVCLLTSHAPFDTLLVSLSNYRAPLSQLRLPPNRPLIPKDAPLFAPGWHLGQAHRLNFVYSWPARKSRRVGQNENIIFIINVLHWSGRRDSNPRPSAPKTDLSFSAKSLINTEPEAFQNQRTC